ncbi:hypothetical protein ATO7_13033 [Oceanococcus atlanticus]|uniref:TPR repeat-containing protein n=1 Tax=Oceanococcus atlanticus TaxID=1317117 RepID=A0A1Y1SC81_9GAMM|nr:hypothetical protein [Oceanococcus atlanticus]ORE86222.1 hypothetical protein ATO7_13033 [Oceanococcus atlanticus]RZO85976.1 MAG: hypothetical protein EVA65_03305 [Oceanococcus sp.]
MSFQRLLIACFALFLSACAVSPEGPVWPYPEAPGDDSWGRQPAPPAPGQDSPSDGDQPATSSDEDAAVSHHPTVLALVSQAEEERAAGDLERASGTLERAIRIVSDDPLPWLRLAEIRFEQGNMVQSENLARRSISFAAPGPLTRQAWLLIADIKRLQGDDSAARQAEDKARGG